MMIIWWSKHVGVILNILLCDIWINVLIQTSALIGQLYLYIVIPNMFINARFHCTGDVLPPCLSVDALTPLAALNMSTPLVCCSSWQCSCVEWGETKSRCWEACCLACWRLTSVRVCCRKLEIVSRNEISTMLLPFYYFLLYSTSCSVSRNHFTVF
jgi:hypothetical protein